MSVEHWWNNTDGGNQSTYRKTCPIATLSISNPTSVGMALNLDPCRDLMGPLERDKAP
jgi:hypothetical protein